MKGRKEMRIYEQPLVEVIILSGGLQLLTNFSLDAVVDDYNEGLDIVYTELPEE